MDTQSPTVYPDLLAETAIPPRGILSQTLSNADGVELVLFAFAAGEALKEHTSSRPAIIFTARSRPTRSTCRRAASRAPSRSS